MPVLDMTALTGTGGEKVGCPTYAANGRIFALHSGGVLTHPKVRYSDDHGDTWEDWAEIRADSAAPVWSHELAIEPSTGHIFYNATNGSGGVRGIGKIDASTKAVSFEFAWYYPVSVNPYCRMFTWNWTVDNDGYLYISQYGFPVSDTETGCYVWRKAPGSATWVRKDTVAALSSTSRHVHSMHADPYDGRLWINVGDWPRATFYSDDNLNTAAIVSNAASEPEFGEMAPEQQGFTGLTFDEDYAIFGDDYVGPGTRIWSFDKSRPVGAYDNYGDLSGYLPSHHQVPIYYTRSVRGVPATGSGGELWYTTINDGGYSPGDFCLVRMTYAPDAWGYYHPVFTDVKRVSGPTASAAYAYDLAHDGTGTIPADSGFIYAGLSDGSSIRVQRLTDDEIWPPSYYSLTFDLYSVPEPASGTGAVETSASGQPLTLNPVANVNVTTGGLVNDVTWDDQSTGEASQILQRRVGVM